MLKVGERGRFRHYDGRTVVTGRVLFIFNGVYFVSAERFCTMYSDGLFRFRERDRYEDPDLGHPPPGLPAGD